MRTVSKSVIPVKSQGHPWLYRGMNEYVAHLIPQGSRYIINRLLIYFDSDDVRKTTSPIKMVFNDL